LGRSRVVERYRLKVKALAEYIRKSPDGMSHALARGVGKRAQDDDFRNKLNDLDYAITSPHFSPGFVTRATRRCAQLGFLIFGRGGVLCSTLSTRR